MKTIIGKKHRLNLKEYCGIIRASFTICVNHSSPVFINPDIPKLFVGTLKEAKQKYSCINWIYVFMPDHMHLILEGTHEYSDLWKTIVWFKQTTGYWLAKNMPGVQWQRSFYDHIHRSEKELIKHIIYIANNPVRKKLVKNWEDYPFTGSLDNELREIIC